MFPTLYSLLSPQALQTQVLSRYDLPDLARCDVDTPAFIRFYNRGANDTYQVQAGTDLHYLRVANHHGQSLARLEGELALLEALGANGLHVALPLASKDGRLVQTLDAPEGPRHAVLFCAAPGMIGYPGPIRPKHARALGIAIAQLHLAADALDQDFGRPTYDAAALIDAPLAAIAPYLDADEQSYLKQLAIRVAKRLRTLRKTPPAFGLCHGDLNGGNVSFTPDGAVHLFDFEHAARTWRVYDLATFRSITRDTPLIWKSFLAGYSTIRRPTQTELNALPALEIARVFSLMALQVAIADHWGHLWRQDRLNDHLLILKSLESQLH